MYNYAKSFSQDSVIQDSCSCPGNWSSKPVLLLGIP